MKSINLNKELSMVLVPNINKNIFFNHINNICFIYIIPFIFVLVSLTQLTWTLDNICRDCGLNPGHFIHSLSKNEFIATKLHQMHYIFNTKTINHL